MRVLLLAVVDGPARARRGPRELRALELDGLELELAALLGLAAALVSGASSSPCRTKPSDASWPSRAQWATLNASIAGRLVPVPDELEACLGDAASAACEADLNSTDEENFLTFEDSDC